MKLYWRENVYGWVMTGLVGKGAKWFFGFSRVPSPEKLDDLVNQITPENRHPFVWPGA